MPKATLELRQTLHAQICDVVASVAGALEKQKGIVSPDASLLAQFEALEGEDASAFYHRHKENLVVQLQARQDSQNNN